MVSSAAASGRCRCFFLPCTPLLLFFLLLSQEVIFVPVLVNAFRTAAATRSRISSTRLRDISEWRDLMFDIPAASTDNVSRLAMEEDNDSPPREVCVLPFPFDDAILQGETKELRLYEDRFVQLFEDATTNHGGVVAMGLLAESGIIQTVPLCEIEAYNRMEGFGIFVTIRVVGRAVLVDLMQQEPYIKAVCTEITDKVPPNLELPNIVAGNIENMMVTLSSMEYRLQEAEREERAVDDALDAAGDDEMKLRIAKARLEDKFYYDKGDQGDVDDDDNDDDDDDENDVATDRTGRFRQAFRIARSTDTQGYTVSQDPSNSTRGQRSAQDLTAVSWAAFQTDRLPGEEEGEGKGLVLKNGQLVASSDVTYRIQALDCNDLFERLKLASFMLKEKKAELRKKLAGAGIEYKGGGDDAELDEEL